MIAYKDKENLLRIIFQHKGKSCSLIINKSLFGMDKITLIIECINSVRSRLSRKIKPSSSIEGKKQVAECVYLKKVEIEKLQLKLGTRYNRAIEILNNYKLSSGKIYASDYGAILTWVIDRINKEKADVSHNAKHQMTAEEFAIELKQQ